MRVLIVAIFLAFGAVQAQAQNADVRGLYDRIDRLERDLQTMQSQFARGGASSIVVASPSASSAGNSTSLGKGGMGAAVSDRLDSLEDQIRDLTGKVEEANHHAQQATTKLERFQADAELRFKELSEQVRTLQAPPVAADVPEPVPEAKPDAVVAAPPAGGKKQPVPPNNSAENPGLAPGPQVLGTISDKDLKKAAAAAKNAPAVKDAPKDPKAAYDAAYALYQSNDYDGASDAFKGFLSKFPDHQLAPSATFWVGESAYVQKDYKGALTAFADGYKKFPNSTKAADLLFKMGQSFGQLNMTKQACSSYKLLFEAHKDMPDRLRKAATADKAKLGC